MSVEINFCGFNQNNRVSDIRKDFETNTLEACKEKYTIYRKSARRLGHFDAIMAILLGGCGLGKDYQRKYIDCFWKPNNNNTPNNSSWGQNALQWTKLSTKSLNNFVKTIKEQDTFEIVYYKMLKWNTEHPEKKIAIEVFECFKWCTDSLSAGTAVTHNTIPEKENSMEKDIKDMINNGSRQIIFTGAPGTGKTYIAKKIAFEMGGYIEGGFVQFHPSYDYTDFVEGLRPVEKNGEVSFVKLDGIFKSFCRKVVRNNSEAVDCNLPLYFFIIDEINRANLSKVFGELMYALEKGKRGEDNRIQTQYSMLPTYDAQKGDYIAKADDVFADGFYIPENVIILGSMNDIDRSVDSMDFALRRRFEWMEFVVTEDMLINAFESVKYDIETGGDVPLYNPIIYRDAKAIAEAVDRLNSYIKESGEQYGLNEQYYISQGHFADIDRTFNDTEELLGYVWKYRINTLLKEYLRGENGIDVFLSDAENKFKYKEADEESK